VGHIVLFGSPKPFQKTHYFSGTDAPSSAAKLPKLEALLAHIKDRNQGCLISDAHSDKRWPVSAADLTRSVVVAPMFGRFELLGLLILAHEQPGYFSMDHLLLLQAIASQAAIAIENVRLFSEMQQIAKQPGLELTRETSRSEKSSLTTRRNG
jgi:GAF domain-containing protein